MAIQRNKAKPEKKDALPKHFANLKDAGLFWDTHDSAAYEDCAVEVEFSAEPLTRSFKKTVRSHLEGDPSIRDDLLREGIESLLSGGFETGKSILREYIDATIGFEKLSSLTDKPATSLRRMLGPKGNPQARNLLELIARPQNAAGLRLRLSIKRS